MDMNLSKKEEWRSKTIKICDKIADVFAALYTGSGIIGAAFLAFSGLRSRFWMYWYSYFGISLITFIVFALFFMPSLLRVYLRIFEKKI